MKAMVLAAGFGTRLGDLTRTTPKCLMPLGKGVILDYVVAGLKRAGVDSLVINLHYLADQVRAHVAHRGDYGISVKFSDESEILGTGGGVQHARSLLEGDDFFLVHNADVYTEVPLMDLVAAHQQSVGAFATLAVMQRVTKRPLLFTESGQLSGWQGGDGAVVTVKDQQQGRPWAFSGIQVVDAKLWPIFDHFSGRFSIIEVYMRAALKHPVKAFDMTAHRWVDIGTAADLERLRCHVDAIE